MNLGTLDHPATARTLCRNRKGCGTPRGVLLTWEIHALDIQRAIVRAERFGHPPNLVDAP